MTKGFASMLASVILVAGVACGDSRSTPVDAAALDAHVTTRTFKDTVTDQNTGAPISGAQVCTTLPGSTCMTTAADGTYSIELTLPDGATQFAETTTAPGRLGRQNLYFEVLSAQTGYSVFWDEIGGLYSIADATTFLSTRAGFTYPTTTNGFVQVLCSTPTPNQWPRPRRSPRP